MNGSGALNRSRLSPNPPGAQDDSSYNAALKGASLAFQKSAPKQLPPSTPTSRNVDNRALIAATSAASASRDHSRAISRQTTGSSIQGGNGDSEIEQGGMSQSSTKHLQLPSQWNHGTSSHLGPASRPTMPDPRSPSFIAATLAASRSVSPARNQATQSRPYSPQPVGRQRKHSTASSVASLDLATDTTSIPSTNTLISMFEKRKDDTDPVKKGVIAEDSRKPLKAESKPRAPSPPRTKKSIANNELSPSKLASSPARRNATSPSPTMTGPSQERNQKPDDALVKAKARPPAPPPARAKNKAQESAQPVSLEVKGKPRASTPPPKSISRANTVILSPKPKRPVPRKILLNDITAQDALPEGQTSPPGKSKQYPPSPVHNVAEKPVPEDNSRRTSTSSNDTFVSASSVPTSHPGSPERGRSRPSSPDTVRPRRPPSAQTVSTTTSTGRPPPLPRRHTQQATSNLSLESLTDAIMAGSLASSRITPAKTPPPQPPSRRQTPHMRQTLRQPPSKSDDEGGSRARSRRRKPLGKLAGGNKHAHHEGARKRWREEITPRERKRYEGVWASNRGLLLVAPNNSSSSSISISNNGQPQLHPQPQPQPQPQPSQSQAQTPAQALEKEKEQCVANVVVRDIWARSRLPFDELAEVWDLVDRRGLGFLDRTEFVVGMWLIDQRLRGRKIPRKVTESVWGSARGVGVEGVRGRRRK
ncbi:hypothetical protein M434DRAFT_393596 [Hypoxylon sp. CO27-5]|nr:hypothetical protein M434DRAFT_393596 [Hypoxylon sp. CO27-5]